MNILLHVMHVDDSPEIYIVDTNKIENKDVLDLISEAKNNEYTGLEITDTDGIIIEYLYDSDSNGVSSGASGHFEKKITVWLES